jgi:hypothetical protein
MASTEPNQIQIEAGVDPALAAAFAVLRGAIVPMLLGFQRLGFDINRRAIHARLLAGTLPVQPVRMGRNWFITAGAAAALFRSGGVAPAAALPPPSPRRGPGRPRGTTRRASK